MTLMDKKLFIFVEGEDDKYFFEKIVKPDLEKRYEAIIVKKYAEEKKDNIKKLVKSIGGRHDYIFITDINSSPCIIAKKEKLFKEYNFEKHRIIVVKPEIESWYLAGLNEENSKKLKVQSLKNTDKINKEVFNKLIKKARFDSRIDFMVEILNHFSIETAIEKNKTFKYFIDKIVR